MANKNNSRKGGRIQGGVEAEANLEVPLYAERPCVSGFFLMTSSWMGSWTALPVRYFLHDLVMGGISHNGSQQSAAGMYRCFLQRATSLMLRNTNNLLDTCSGKIHALLGRKVMTNLDRILKSRDVTLRRKILLCHNHLGYGLSSSHVWMWELDYKESWAPKNWCFWTVVWRRLVRVLWTARRSNQSILKEISPEYSLEGLMLKLKLQ